MDNVSFISLFIQSISWDSHQPPAITPTLLTVSLPINSIVLCVYEKMGNFKLYIKNSQINLFIPSLHYSTKRAHKSSF